MIHFMKDYRKEYKAFYDALIVAKDKYGRGFNKFLNLETGLTTGFLSLVINGVKKPSLESQIKILKACGINYEDMFFEEKRICSNKNFKNQSTADEVIDLLIELESIDQFALGEIGRIVREKIQILRTKNRIDEPILKPEQIPKKRVG